MKKYNEKNLPITTHHILSGITINELLKEHTTRPDGFTVMASQKITITAKAVQF